MHPWSKDSQIAPFHPENSLDIVDPTRPGPGHSPFGCIVSWRVEPIGDLLVYNLIQVIIREWVPIPFH